MLSKNPKSWAKFFGILLIGGLVGYAYYYFWGCNGSCTLTNNATKTVGIGMLLAGNFGFDLIVNKKNKNRNGGKDV